MKPHEVLGVRAGATPEELRRAWRRAAASTHPDRGGDRRAFERVAAAYQRLLAGCSDADTVLVVRRLGPRHLAVRWVRRRLGRGPKRVI